MNWKTDYCADSPPRSDSYWTEIRVAVSITARYFAAKAATGFTADDRHSPKSLSSQISDALEMTSLCWRDWRVIWCKTGWTPRCLLPRLPSPRGDCDGLVVNGNGMVVCHHSSTLAVVVEPGIIYWTIPIYRVKENWSHAPCAWKIHGACDLRTNHEEREIQSFREAYQEALNQAQQRWVASQEPWIHYICDCEMWRSSSFFMAERLKSCTKRTDSLCLVVTVWRS